MDLKIIIFCVAHKPLPYELPEGYVELGVGSNIKAQYFTGVGDHINDRNNRYSEVSAIYWALNNLDLTQYDFIGLVHYRRFFYPDTYQSTNITSPLLSCSPADWINLKKSASINNISKSLLENDGLAPVVRGFGRSVRQFYADKHKNRTQDLELAYEKAVSHELFSSEFAANELNQPFLTPYCMSILRTSLWISVWKKILSTLLEIEPNVSVHQDPYQNRNLGFLAERLHSSALGWLQSGGYRIHRLPIMSILS